MSDLTVLQGLLATAQSNVASALRSVASAQSNIQQNEDQIYALIRSAAGLPLYAKLPLLGGIAFFSGVGNSTADEILYNASFGGGESYIENGRGSSFKPLFDEFVSAGEATCPTSGINGGTGNVSFLAGYNFTGLITPLQTATQSLLNNVPQAQYKLIYAQAIVTALIEAINAV